MKSLNAYLFFTGNCREALKFYEHAMNGRIDSLQTYEEGKMAENDSQKDLVMHADFRVGDIHLMAADSVRPVESGSNISLNLNFESEDEQTKVFNKLSEGGKVTMQLEDTFWGARFGMLQDKFGVNWMLNCEKK